MSSSLRHLPNIISAARVVMVAPIVWSLLNRQFELAIWLFLIAGASDGLDGFLAKRFGWTSRLGGILDALADKALLVSTFVCLWWLALFPAWLVLAVLGIVSAWLVLRDRRRRDAVATGDATPYSLLATPYLKLCPIARPNEISPLSMRRLNPQSGFVHAHALY